jgi:hypothetical protein
MNARLAALLVAVALALAVEVAAAGPAAARAPGCVDSFLPVSLAPGQPADQQVAVRLCLPAGATPNTVQLLVHGCLYNGRYWDFPDPAGGTDRYSFMSHALHARYAALTIDMLGTGRSSHPLSAQATVDAGVWVIHQVVQALRGVRSPARAVRPRSPASSRSRGRSGRSSRGWKPAATTTSMR